jgi:hypothetical protein
VQVAVQQHCHGHVHGNNGLKRKLELTHHMLL